MERVQLGDIYNQGFVYREYDENTVILHRLESLNFHVTEVNKNLPIGGELHYFIKDYYLSLWREAGIFIENVTFTSRMILPGSYVDLHSDMSNSQYKAIIFCPKEEYKGAEFVYGIRGEKLNRKKLKFGDIIFCKTGDDRLVHGFTKLESNEPIVYLELYGGLNRKKPIEDQYYADLDIQKLEP
ncbi:MAG: hypothetical protein PHY47_00185 [Lachnospiraceae bacterium]|nr:hypothetical protein [Lachnospiraceae bacterium]